MYAIVSSLLRVIKFHFQGKIITVEQLAFFNSDSRVDNVPFIGNTPTNYENIRVGMFKDSLLRDFPIPPPKDSSTITRIDMILSVMSQNQSLLDSWIVPEPSDCQRYGDTMPLNEIEITYQYIRSTSEIIDKE